MKTYQRFLRPFPGFPLQYSLADEYHNRSTKHIASLYSKEKVESFIYLYIFNKNYYFFLLQSANNYSKLAATIFKPASSFIPENVFSTTSLL